MEFLVLGPIEVTDGLRRIDLGPRMPRAVLSMLVMDANRVVSLDRLIDNLWGEEPPATATKALQVYISGLRKVLEPDRAPGVPSRVVVTQPPGYLLRVEPDAVDAARFDALLAEGRALLGAGRPASAIDALDRALGLWRGSAYEDLGFESFLQPEIARLNQLRAAAAEARAEALLALGQHTEAVSALEAMVAEDPLRERRWELLALSLYRDGRQAEALRAIDRARRMLGEELGLDPGPALRRLEGDILGQSPDLEWQPALDERVAELMVPAEAPVVDTVVVPTPPLVGRDEEMARLGAALEAVHRGRGAVALVSGEPGIGKTRLVEELAARATAGGMAVAWGRCDEGEAAPAYWPWIQMLRTLLDTCERDAVRAALGTGGAAIAQVVPDVKEFVDGPLEPLPLLEPEVARSRLYDAIIGFVTGLSTDRPILLAFDDLHWADAPSLQLMRLLTTQISDVPILSVATYRPVEAEAAEDVQATLARLVRAPMVVDIRPEGLTDSEVGHLVAVATGGDPPPGVAEAIRARTEGNPFFVSELVRLLQSERNLEAAAQGEIPLAVREVIRRRLARVPDEAVTLLTTAAVIGRDFDLDVLAAASNHDEDHALELVEAGLLVGVVTEQSDGGSYRFSHSLVRETLYDGLSAGRRARLHRRVGEALERLRLHNPPLVELAHHFFEAARAGDRDDRAFNCALGAAAAAQGSLAFEQAEDQLRRALTLVGRLPPGPDRDRRELDVLLRLGSQLMGTAGYGAAKTGEAFARARRLCEELGETGQIVRVLYGVMAYEIGSARHRSGRELADELLDIGERSGRPADLVVGHQAVGLAAQFQGEVGLSRTHLERALALPNGLMDSEVVAWIPFHPVVGCWTLLAEAVWLGGERARARELVGEAVQFATDLAHDFTLAHAQNFEAFMAVLDRDAQAARDAAERSRSFCLEKGFPLYLGFATVYRGWALAQQGDAEAGAAEIGVAVERLRAAGALMCHTFFLALLAECQQLVGAITEALGSAGTALELVETTGERFWEAELHRLRGELLFQMSPGRGAEAEAELRTAAAVARSQGATSLEERAAESLRRLIPGGRTA